MVILDDNESIAASKMISDSYCVLKFDFDFDNIVSSTLMTKKDGIISLVETLVFWFCRRLNMVENSAYECHSWEINHTHICVLKVEIVTLNGK